MCRRRSDDKQHSVMASALAPSRAPVVRGGTTRRRIPAARILVPRASAEPVTSLAAELASLVARGSHARDDARVRAIVDELERARAPPTFLLCSY